MWQSLKSLIGCKFGVLPHLESMKPQDSISGLLCHAATLNQIYRLKFVSFVNVHLPGAKNGRTVGMK